MIDGIDENNEINVENMNQHTGTINKLLSDTNTKLESLLREEDILYEIECHNEKLIKYFDIDKIKQLLDYIIKEPEIDEKNLDSNENKEKGYKFPFISSQIFEIKTQEIFKYFFMTNKEIKEEENKEKTNETNKDNNKAENNKNVDKESQNKNENKEGEKAEADSSDNRIELLDYLFAFLPKEYKEEKKLNYVLCGYFSSLIRNLLEVNPMGIINYVYNIRKDLFNLMITHSYRKSILDALSRILQLEKYFQDFSSKSNEKIKNSMNDTRIEVLKNIFSSINIDMDNEKLNSIYFFIIGLFDSNNIMKMKEFFKKMIDNKNIAKALINKPLNNIDLITNTNNIENKRNNFTIIIDIIKFLLRKSKVLEIKIPDYSSSTSLTIRHTKLSSELLDILPKLIKNNFNKKNNEDKKILQCFNEYELLPLGEYKIKIVELISYLIPYFKKISKNFDKILINTEFFKNGFEYVFEYEWNNLYQESFLRLLNASLEYSAYHEQLFNYLFNKLKIVEIIKAHVNNEDKFKFINNEISSNISHGYISFLISLCYKINTIIGGAPLGFNLNPSTEGNFEFLQKLDKENENNHIEIPFDYENEDDNKIENNEEYKGGPIESMKKYLNDDWKTFFNDNISKSIKQYADRSWPKVVSNMDIFDFLFEDSNSKENTEEKRPENKDINNDSIKDKNENIKVNDENKDIITEDKNNGNTLLKINENDKK